VRQTTEARMQVLSDLSDESARRDESPAQIARALPPLRPS